MARQIPISDPIARRQALLLQSTLLVWITLILLWQLSGFLIALVSPTAAQSPVGEVPPFFVVLGALGMLAGTLLWLVPIIALVVLRRGHFRAAASTATFGLLLAHTIATVMLGVTNGAVLIVFQVPIMLAGLLLSRRMLVLVAGMCITIVLVVAFLQTRTPPLAGFFAMLPGSGQTSASVAAQLGLLLPFFIGVTLVQSLLLERFAGVWRDALGNSLERERELQEIRSTLELTVAERTGALRSTLESAQARATELAQLLAENAQQRLLIKDLSVPVIPVSAATLVMPLVGALDSTRLLQIQEQGLQALEHTSARTLVLDITGVPIVDSQVAQGLLVIMQSARLLGATVMLVGVRPEVAQAVVGLGLDLGSVQTFRDLETALRHN